MAVIRGCDRLPVIYNGAKSVGTVPAVFWGFQTTFGGAGTVFG
jgi:hypothetical protein